MKLLHWIKNRLIITSFVVILLLWALFKFWMSGNTTVAISSKPVYVETRVIKPVVAEQNWQAVATIKAVQDITVASEVAGLVQQIDMPSNQTVHQGDVLLRIKHDDITANLRRDQAVLVQKEIYYQRLTKLIKTHVVSEEALSEALSEYKQAQANLALHEAEINKYVIKAPFSGVIGIWKVNVGQLVKPGDHLVSLTQLSPVYIDFMFPVKALGQIHVGDEVEFTTSNYGERVWYAKVIAIDPQLDNTTRNIQLRAQINNEDGQLVPNLYGQITFRKKHDAQLLIPQESVIYDPQGTSVFVVKNNKVYPKQITLGEHQGDDVIVVNGLKSGDEIVTAGIMKLFPEMDVIVNNHS
ncbi:MAG: efflux RND transporter periplasmic adaptor subunit [Gammaproteobacteria bacterium]